MANYRFQVIIGRANGIARDAMVNVLHTTTTESSPTSAKAIDGAAALRTFFQTVAPYWNDAVISEATDAHEIKGYGLSVGGAGGADDSTGSPLDVTTFSTPTIATGLGGALPASTAVVISLGASPETAVEFSGTTRPKSRHRGRIFLPFLHNDGSNVEFVAGELRIKAAARTFLLDTLSDLVTDLNASGHKLCVYSRQDAVLRPVTVASIDNRLDTIKSRRAVATIRDSVTITQS